MENCWYWKGECLPSAPTGYVGYIYKITTDSDTEAEKVYFGKKLFEFSKKKILSKKARKASGTRKRIERTKIESDWQSYYGSSKKLIEYLETVGYDKCKREILLFCKSKMDLSYYEILIQISENVLFRDDCWNDCIGGKFYKGRVSELLDNEIEDDGKSW